ncbi:MAG: CPBP family intramembrane glutamic endopeptidase [Gemmataceae bacterium]
MEEPTQEDERAVPWGGVELVAVVFLSFLVQSCLFQLFLRAGWFEQMYGAEMVAAALAPTDHAGHLASYRLALWPGFFGTLAQIVLTVAVMQVGPRATFAQMGLTLRHAGRHAIAGLVFAVVFAPGAYAIQAVVLWLTGVLGGKAEDHPFTALGQEGLVPLEWALLIGAAVLLAPLWEELVYRGLIQPWVLDRQPDGGPAVLAVAGVWTLAMRADALGAAAGQGTRDVLVELIPIAALLALVPVYLVLARRGLVLAGLFASAVLFAWIHARVWPSPLPLLWLAIGLGWLRYRTGGLVASVVLHAAFNAIAVVTMLLVSRQ